MERRGAARERVGTLVPKRGKVPEGGRSGARSGDRFASARREQARTRAFLYRLLSTTYLAPPAPDLVRRMTDADFLEDLSLLLGGRAAAELKEYAVGPDGDPGALKQEYMDLFAVPTGRYVAPFEDVYRCATGEGDPGKGALLGERAIAVRRMYREAGAEMDRACRELCTHIGVELSFMSFLCEREADAIPEEKGRPRPDPKPEGAGDSARYRELQVRFLEGHLNDWFPRLSRAIQANARSRFYRALSRVTEEFLAEDAANLPAR